MTGGGPKVDPRVNRILSFTAEERATLAIQLENKSREETSTGCRLWTGPLDRDGYGFIQVGRHQERAHRVAYVLSCGAIAPGLLVRHTCHTPGCIRHVITGTAKQNAADRDLAGRSGTKGRHGPKRPRLTAEDVIAMRFFLNLKMMVKVTAGAFDVCPSTVAIVKRGTSYLRLMEKCNINHPYQPLNGSSQTVPPTPLPSKTAP